MRGLALLACAAIWFLILDVAGAGERMLCQLEPTGRDWHYRTKIAPLPDSKCWYDGPRMKAREELYWAETPKIQPTDAVVPTTVPPWELEPRFRGAPAGWDHKE